MATLKWAQARVAPRSSGGQYWPSRSRLEQLVISMLHDPSVSRVMHEESFSIPAVKATIQQSFVAYTPSPAATFPPSLSSAPADSRPLGNDAAVR